LKNFKKAEKLNHRREREREREGEGEKTTIDVNSMQITQLLFINHKSILKMESITQIHSNKSKEQPWNRLKKRRERTGLEKGARELDWKLE